MKRLALGLLAFLVFAAPARADHGEPVTDPLVVESLQVARDFWGVDIPGAHVAWGEDPRFDSPAFDGHATGELGGTDISLDPRRWGAPFGYVDCQRIVHEYGHLLGHGHEGPPIMVTADERGVVPACERFGVPTFTVLVDPPLSKGRPVELRRVERQPMGRRARARLRRAWLSAPHQNRCQKPRGRCRSQRR